MASPEQLPAIRAQRRTVWLALAIAAILPASLLFSTSHGPAALATAPRGILLHTLLLGAWLAVLVVRVLRRSRAAPPREAGYHGGRSLPSAMLAGTLILLGAYNGAKALVLHTWPAVYPGAYFLALTGMTALAAGLLLIGGSMLRLAAPAQDRLLAGGTAIALQPQLAALVPLRPLGGEASQWLITALGVAAVLWIARLDRRVGAPHEWAWRLVAAVMLGSAVLTSLLPHVWPFEVAANRLMAHQLPFALPGR